MSNVHNELKKEFQLERMILFSDAVFAIAITLMALEIKLPALEGATVTDKALLGALEHLFLKFIGFLLSFFVIGLYWTVHHRIFAYVEGYTPRLLWLNLLFLLSIVLMPFSSGIYGDYTDRLDLLVPYAVYVLNICMTGYFNYRLWKYIGDPKNKIANPLLTPETLRLGLKRGIITSLVFVASFLVATLVFVSVWFGMIARWMPALIPIVMKQVQKRHLKKHPVSAAS